MLAGRGIECLGSNSIIKNEKIVNISENEFCSLESLSYLNDVEEVIADNNQITEDLKLPLLKSLITLSLNKNKINDLGILLENLSSNAPKLKLLSLLGNPICPDPIYSHLRKLKRENIIISQTDNDNDLEDERFETIKIDRNDFTTVYHDDEDEYQRYRLRIIYRLPNLLFLDSTKVTKEERNEAQRRGQFLEPRKLEDATNVVSAKGRKSLVSLSPGMSDWISALSPLKSVENPETTSPLPDEKDKTNTHRICFGKSHYEYHGRNSEGNRFIRNLDL